MSGKWWVILVQAILLVALGYLCIRSPWRNTFKHCVLGKVVLIPERPCWYWRVIGNKEQNRETSGLYCGALAVQCLAFAAGRIGFAMQLITNLLGTWMIRCMDLYTRAGNTGIGSALGRQIFFIGLLSVIFAFTVVYIKRYGRRHSGDYDCRFSIVGAGMGLIILSILKKTIAGSVKAGLRHAQWF